MNYNLKQSIFQILDIIGYENDRDKFANDFLALCLQQAIVNLSLSLSEEKQLDLKNKLSLLTQQEDVEHILLDFFSREEYEKEVKDTTQNMFQDYLKTIVLTLNEKQRNNLKDYLGTQAQLFLSKAEIKDKI